ncbi:MAG: hypothetical protein OXU73_01960 [Candidatus Campbellbacteria bacterium]|nr:hypothetical protein [Candidatus Campbellbacteria bacterium]
MFGNPDAKINVVFYIHNDKMDEWEGRFYDHPFKTSDCFKDFIVSLVDMTTMNVMHDINIDGQVTIQFRKKSTPRSRCRAIIQVLGKDLLDEIRNHLISLENTHNPS